MLISLQEFRKRKEQKERRDRLESLRRRYARDGFEDNALEVENNLSLLYFTDLSERANGNSNGSLILFKCLLLGCMGALLGIQFHPILMLFLASIAFYIPIYLAENAAKSRADKFSNEYPTILLATASNMKAGLTVYAALERSIWLLPEESEVKTEVKKFLDNISKGVPKDIAVKNFAKTVSLPELELFRRAFVLVLSHGGKFSRTLERLAEVCRDRETLIKSSKVSTASMRMTANILLGATPLLVGALSLRSKDYWQTLFNNSTASTLGFLGLGIIVTAYIILCRMSNFKP